MLGNVFRPGEEADRRGLRVDTGEYNPLLGKSYAEIAGESRSQHKSQGIGQGGRRGSRSESFEVVAGDSATEDIFEGIEVTWNRIPGGQKVGFLLAEILKSFDPLRPSKSIPGLLAVNAELARLPEDPWVLLKKRELSGVIQACAGIWLEAIAGDYSAAAGDPVQIRTTIINRSDRPFSLHSLEFPGVMPAAIVDLPLNNNEPVALDRTIQIPKDFPLSQPYWLVPVSQSGRGSAEDPRFAGQAENPPSVSAKIGLSIEGVQLDYEIPLLFRWSDPVQGELYRPFEIRPRVTIQVETKVHIFADGDSRQIKVRLKSHSPNVSGFIRLTGPDPWRVTPSQIPFSLTGKYAETEVAFDVVPPKTAGEASLTAEAEIGGENISRDLCGNFVPSYSSTGRFPGEPVESRQAGH